MTALTRTALGEPGDCAAQERDGAAGRQRRQDLGVGQTRVVIDHHVDVLEASHAAALVPAPLAAAVADDAMAGAEARDPPKRLDVHVDELACSAALIAIGRLGRLEPGALAEPDPLQPGRDG
jgi:hypothetical protein